MSHTAVVIMAKVPYPGQVKTRLCPPLTAWQAAALSRAFLFDKIAQVRMLTSARPAIAYTPASGEGFFGAIAPDFTLIAQQGADLGERLIHSLEYFLHLGCAGVMAIDSDTPTLPTQYLQQAIALLTKPDVDVVVGPSDDGGYYLIGIRAMHRDLFIDMPWSTSAVLPETVRRAEARGLSLARLPAWFDVDTPEDLTRLRTMLAQTAGEAPRYTGNFFWSIHEAEPQRSACPPPGSATLQRGFWSRAGAQRSQLPGKTLVIGSGCMNRPLAYWAFMHASSNSNAALANIHILASRFATLVSIVSERSTGPATAIHACPASSP